MFSCWRSSFLFFGDGNWDVHPKLWQFWMGFGEVKGVNMGAVKNQEMMMQSMINTEISYQLFKSQNISG